MMMLHGSSEYQVLFTANGWSLSPSVPRHLNSYFEQLPSPILVDLISRSFFKEASEDVFTNPLDLNSQFQSSFRAQKDTVRSGKYYPIRWCEDCIRQQISVRGYGHFRAAWLNGVQCMYHQKPLMELSVGLSGGAKLLARKSVEILKGCESEYSREVAVNPLYDASQLQVPLSNRDIHLSVCAREAFSKWSSTDESLVSYEGEICTVDYGAIPAEARRAFIAYERRSSHRRFASVLYEQVAEADYGALETFLYEKLELAEAYLALGEGKSASTLILRGGGKNCSKCLETECVANKLILLSKVYSSHDICEELNPCDSQLENMFEQIERNAFFNRLDQNWRCVEAQEYWYRIDKLSPLENISD